MQLPPRARQLASFGAALASAAVLAACGSTAVESITGPLPDKCAVTLSPAAATLEASGGTGSISVTTDPECAWTAEAQASWIADVSPTRGQGSGQIAFRLLQNPAGTARESALVVNDERVTVRQNGTACAFDVAASNTRFAAAGGSGTLTVSGPAGCAWTAESSVPWIAVPASAGGSGNGTASFTVAQNGGAERTGTLTVGGIGIAITQDAAAAVPPPPAQCTITLQPTAASMPASGGTSTVTVTAGSGCPWTASASATWITFTTAASGSGAGSFRVSVAANAGAQRTGVVTVGSATFTVNQAASATSSCTYSIAPTSASAAAGGGSGSVSVSVVGSGCAWTAASNAPWLTIISGASGSGAGTVSYSVAANTGPQRAGTLIIAGHTFTVTQAAAAPACTYAISPTSQTIGENGGAGVPVSVTAPAGCTWTAASNASWLSITSGGTGSGSGTVTFTVAANTGAQRTGTLTIAGQTFTVTQAAAQVTTCTYAINPSAQTVGGGGGTFSVSVTAPSGCAWTATANAGWLSITSGSNGSGNGTVAFTVGSFQGAMRTGTLTIAGQTFTVTQVR